MNHFPIKGNLKELAESDAFYKIILYLFYNDAKNKADKEWESFYNSLVFENRFSSNSKIIEELHNKSDMATYIMPMGKVLYRARVFNDDLMSGFIKEFVFSKENFSEIKDVPQLDLNTSQLLPLIMATDSKARFAKIKKAYGKWKNKKYKGYNSKNSGSPPNHLATLGRANPEYISYLYLCEDEQTPIYEVQPIIGQNVSVAKFKTRKPLKIYDLTRNFPNHHEDPDYDTPSMFDVIGKNFSVPNYGKPVQYLPTQFISEEIKKMGFDGLRFNSSLRQGGINVVLFDSKSCIAQSSDIVKIENIDIKTRRPDVYNLETLNASILDV